MKGKLCGKNYWRYLADFRIITFRMRLERPRRELAERKSIVLITACPLDYEQNDDDCDCMHEMFTEQGLPFEKHCVIDKRTELDTAKELVENALDIGK